MEAAFAVLNINARESATDAAMFLYGLPDWHCMTEENHRCDWLRCIFGNPFRPVSVDAVWLTANVVAIAQGIYAEPAFDRLPILADALEDAGCTNADIFNHCRQPGEHVRGCWVVDLALGKS
jgi:hypothetical protein